MDRLYSRNPIVREKEAAKYRVFHKNVKIPSKWREDWNELLCKRDVNNGLAWPPNLLKLMRRRRWPEYSFGTANASCLVVMHRPGGTDANKVMDMFISPGLPILGGIPHAHNAFWYPRYSKSQTYRSLHSYLKPAFATLKNPWSQVMTTCLTTSPAHTGEVDAAVNLRAVKSGLLDFMVNLCQPQLILLCGGAVHKAVSKANWSPPPKVEVLECTHPMFQHWSRDGNKVRDATKKVLFS